MTKILITGNGFDLAQGLPTRYADFIEVMNKLNSIDKENISDDIKDYFDLNERKKNTKQIELFNKSNSLNIEKLEGLKSRLDNKWLNHFKYKLDIDTWIDFETELEKTISILTQKLLMIETVNLSRSFDINKKFNLQSDHFVQKYQDRKLLENLGFIICEADQFHYNSKYWITENNLAVEFKIGLFLNDIYNEWSNFVKIFNDYLYIFVNPIINLIDDSEILNVNFHYTFNYTNTYDKFLSSTIQTRHLHGKIDSYNDNNNIVLGFNNESKFDYLKQKEILLFTKGHQRMNNDLEIKLFDGMGPIVGLEIYIWGHSLDKSDKNVLDQILNMLEGNLVHKNVSLKIITNNSKSNLITNLIQIYSEQRISELISSKKIIFISNNDLYKEGLLVTKKKKEIIQ